MNPDYVDTVRVMLAVAPAVFESGRFALKGGTALNLFVQDVPRLSVDLDLVFVDHALDRTSAITEIARDLARAQASIERRGYRVHASRRAQGDDVKLVVDNGHVRVKVEVNVVFRGTALPTEMRALVPTAQDLFTTDLTVPTLTTSELYGSKLVAALDRQHPRDLFDVMHMLRTSGWQQSVVDCFVVYLAGHNRPIHEVLFAPRKPLEPAFGNEFAGMTRDPIHVEPLLDTQARLSVELPRQLTSDHRSFLLSLVQCEPRWDLMPMPHLRDLPAIRWRLTNLEKLRRRRDERFALQHQRLAARLAAIDG